MTSNLPVALLTCGISEHVHPFNDGVFAELAFDVKNRLLNVLFGNLIDTMRIFSMGRLCAAIVATFIIAIIGDFLHIRKQIGLNVIRRSIPLSQLFDRLQIRSNHIQSTYQQPMIDDFAEQFVNRITDTRGG